MWTKIKGKFRKPTKKDYLPKYIIMGSPESGTCMRLNGSEYWRDGGQWGVNYRFIGNQLVSYNPGKWMPHLHRVPLTEVTEEQWRKDNGQYAEWAEDDKNWEDDLAF